jgi:hypothetical protein
MVQEVLRVLLAHKVGRVLQVQLLVHKVIEEHKALKVHRVGKEPLVTEELMVQEVRKEIVGHKDLKVVQVL